VDGDFPFESQFVHYIPTEPADWTPDPTNVREALDDLAHRGNRISWGNESIGTTSTTRYLAPAYDQGTSPTSEIGQTVARAGNVRIFTVFHNAGNGNGNDVVYTLRVNGIDTALTVTLASTDTAAVTATGAVAVVAGDVLTVSVAKAIGINSSPDGVLAMAIYA
jgi:hypothetical protein